MLSEHLGACAAACNETACSISNCGPIACLHACSHLHTFACLELHVPAGCTSAAAPARPLPACSHLHASCPPAAARARLLPACSHLQALLDAAVENPHFLESREMELGNSMTVFDQQVQNVTCRIPGARSMVQTQYTALLNGMRSADCSSYPVHTCTKCEPGVHPEQAWSTAPRRHTAPCVSHTGLRHLSEQPPSEGEVAEEGVLLMQHLQSKGLGRNGGA